MCPSFSVLKGQRLGLRLGASIAMLIQTKKAAKRRKNAAHGASRGANTGNDQAPKGRKKSSSHKVLAALLKQDL
jgi:hypothetical protein